MSLSDHSAFLESESKNLFWSVANQIYMSRSIIQVKDFRIPYKNIDWTKIQDLNFSPIAFEIYRTALMLNVFKFLNSRPVTADYMAKQIGTIPKATEILLNALVGLGLLTKCQNMYISTPTSEMLAQWKHFRVLGRTPSSSSLFGQRLRRILKTGKVKELTELTVPAFKLSGFQVQNFYALKALTGEFQQTLKMMEEHGIFNSVNTFIDIGGGHGIYSIGFINNFPHMMGTIYDLPHVIPITRRFLKKYSMEKRIQTISGSLYEDSIPGNYDLAFMSDVSLTKQKMEAVFRKVYNILNPGGVFVIKDIVPENDWSESFHQLAPQIFLLTYIGDINKFDLPPTARQQMEVMKQVGFSKVQFLGWIRDWCTVFAGWK
jgi:ubiquinone/menaquinone biosynthesis C-methylase UbiE